MINLYKPIVNVISDDLKRSKSYVACCILGRYTAKRSEIPIFIKGFEAFGIKVSERDFLHGTRISNHPAFKLFRSMHTKPEHDKQSKFVRPRLV